MTMREASDVPEEPAVERDLSSLARLLHYAMCEADELGQPDAAALIDAAILSLKAGDASVSDIAEARSDQPTHLLNRKFC